MLSWHFPVSIFLFVSAGIAPISGDISIDFLSTKQLFVKLKLGFRRFTGSTKPRIIPSSNAVNFYFIVLILKHIPEYLLGGYAMKSFHIESVKAMSI